MKNTLLLIIITLSSFKIFAQNNKEQVSIGLKLGYGSSIVIFNDSRYSNVSSNGRGHFSAFLNKPLKEKFSVQVGLSYTDRGFYTAESIVSGNTFSLYGNSCRLFYLEVPMNAVLKLPLGKGNVLLGGGPYMAYALGGNLQTNIFSQSFNNFGQTEISETEEKRNLNFGNKFTDDFNPIDFGINFLVGYQIKKGWLLNFNYSQGIKNILPKEQTSNGEKAINGAFNICLGYEF